MSESGRRNTVRPATVQSIAGQKPSEQQCPLDFLYRFRHLDATWTSVRAVERCPASPYAVQIIQDVEAFLRGIVS